MLWNMFEISGGSMLAYAVLDPRGFSLACVFGMLLGAGLWWLCLYMARNWNRSYRLLPAQHALCAIAAAWTLFICVALASVAAVDSYFDELVDHWDAAVHAQGLSDGGAGLLASLQMFEVRHPFVRAVLESNTNNGDLSARIEALRSNAATTVDTVAGTLKEEFRDRVDWAVFRLRVFLLLSFLVLQALLFGLIGFAAHRDIRPAF